MNDYGYVEVAGTARAPIAVNPPSFVEVTHVFANAPESRKAGCIMPQERRAKMLMQFANSIGADVVIIAESGTYLEAEVTLNRPGWRASYGPPNDHVNGRDIGNGQISRRRIHLAQRRKIASRRTGKGGPLFLTVRLYELDGAEWVVVGFHLQTVRADRLGRSRRAMTKALIRYTRQLVDAGFNVVLTGDTNSGERWDRKFKHLERAHRHKVDTMLVSPGIEVRSTATHMQRRLSDHHFISAVLAIPVGTTPTKRLPKP